MALTAEQLLLIRAEIGEGGVEDYELEDLYARFGSAHLVVAHLLRERHTELVSSPAQFSTEGYSQNVSANIEALERKIERAEGLAKIELGGAINVSSIGRTWSR